MSAEARTPAIASDAPAATFELERFAWDGPDRIEVTGRFSGLAAPPDAPPVLAVSGAAGVTVLEAVPGSVSGPPAEHEPWSATFAWTEAPTAFDGAELRLGELLVALPNPRSRRPLFGRQVFDVRRAGAEAPPPAAAEPVADAPPSAAPEPGGDAPPPAAPEPVTDPPPAAGTEGVRLQADLLVAQEEAHELREALARARAELEAERERHAAAIERFRSDLAAVSASADQAVAGDRREAEALRARVGDLERELADARARADQHEAAGAAVGETRAALEAVLARLPGSPAREDP